MIHSLAKIIADCSKYRSKISLDVVIKPGMFRILKKSYLIYLTKLSLTAVFPLFGTTQ